LRHAVLDSGARIVCGKSPRDPDTIRENYRDLVLAHVYSPDPSLDGIAKA